MKHEEEIKRKDGGVVNDDGRQIRIDEQRDKIKGIKLGTNQEPNKPKPEPSEND